MKIFCCGCFPVLQWQGWPSQQKSGDEHLRCVWSAADHQFSGWWWDARENLQINMWSFVSLIRCYTCSKVKTSVLKIFKQSYDMLFILLVCLIFSITSVLPRAEQPGTCVDFRITFLHCISFYHVQSAVQSLHMGGFQCDQIIYILSFSIG